MAEAILVLCYCIAATVGLLFVFLFVYFIGLACGCDKGKLILYINTMEIRFGVKINANTTSDGAHKPPGPIYSPETGV